MEVLEPFPQLYLPWSLVQMNRSLYILLDLQMNQENKFKMFPFCVCVGREVMQSSAKYPILTLQEKDTTDDF